MERPWKEAFVASIAATYGSKLVRFFAARLRVASEADDFAQEVYLRLLRLDRPDLIRQPEAYLFTIAANIVREQALKRATRPVLVGLDETSVGDLLTDAIHSSAMTPEEIAFEADRIRELETTLAELSPKARAALIWHRRDGMTYNEIGRRLGVSRNMVKKYLSRAIAKCRKARDGQRETQ
jgi:RNA polymerase sigma-70 factor (ECF subfamily)